MGEEWGWKDRLRLEIPVNGAAVLTYTFRFENERVVAKRHEDRVTSAEVKKALVDAGADGDCDHCVPFDEYCKDCDIDEQVHRAETDVEFPRGRC